MKKCCVFLLALLIPLLWNHVSMNAQIKIYPGGVFLTGDLTSAGRYSGLFNGWLYQFQAGPGSYLRFQVGTANPRISGTYDNVAFYDLDSRRFNDIQVGTIYQNSDARMKTNIVSLGEGMSLIKELKPVSYTWLADPQDNNKNHNRMLKGVKLKETGFVAQDVEKVLPGAVITDHEGHKLLNYSAIIPILTKAVQELQGEVDSLKVEIKTSAAH